jgi:elongator complex protein 1
MSLHKLALTHKAVDVALSMSGTRLAVLSNADVAIYTLDLKQRPVPLPTLLWRSEPFVDICPRHVAFRGDDQICVLSDAWDEDESSIWISESEELLYKGPILEATKVSSITSNVEFQRLYVHFQDGRIHEMLIDQLSNDSMLQTSLEMRLSSFASDAKITQLNGNVGIVLLGKAELTCTSLWLLA